MHDGLAVVVVVGEVEHHRLTGFNSVCVCPCMCVHIVCVCVWNSCPFQQSSFPAILYYTKTLVPHEYRSHFSFFLLHTYTSVRTRL